MRIEVSGERKGMLDARSGARLRTMYNMIIVTMATRMIQVMMVFCAKTKTTSPAENRRTEVWRSIINPSIQAFACQLLIPWYKNSRTLAL
jgi:hypothetical protein